MTPVELKKANIERFEALIRAEADQRRCADLEAALERERSRPLDSYPNTPFAGETLRTADAPPDGRTNG